MVVQGMMGVKRVSADSVMDSTTERSFIAATIGVIGIENDGGINIRIPNWL